MRRIKGHTGFWWRNRKEGDPFEDPRLGVRIILKWIFETGMGVYGLDRSGSEQGQVSGSCKCGNEPSGFLKFWEIIEYPRTC
jgi:hypothetical protein